MSVGTLVPLAEYLSTAYDPDMEYVPSTNGRTVDFLLTVEGNDPRRSVPIHRLLKETFGSSHVPFCRFPGNSLSQ